MRALDRYSQSFASHCLASSATCCHRRRFWAKNRTDDGIKIFSLACSWLSVLVTPLAMDVALPTAAPRACEIVCFWECDYMTVVVCLSMLNFLVVHPCGPDYIPIKQVLQPAMNIAETSRAESSHHHEIGIISVSENLN